MIYIYSLVDPITEKTRYIGKTTNLKERLHKHTNVYHLKNNFTHKANWIKSLLKRNTKPIIRILELTNKRDWKSKEKYWIERYKQDGYDLTNLTPGGDGVEKGTIPWNKGKKGLYKASEETKKKLSLMRKGKKRSTEWKRNLSIAATGNQNWVGRKHSEKTIKLMRTVHKKRWVGKEHSDTTKAKMSTAITNWWMSKKRQD